jgi:hypothetical protein
MGIGSADLPNDDCVHGLKRDTESTFLKVIYNAHSYNGPYPDLVSQPVGQNVSTGGNTHVVRTSKSLAVKYGPHVKVTEAESLIFLEKSAPGIPAPRVHACYTMGPFDRDPADFGTVYDTYIVMIFIEGETLDEAWPSLSDDRKSTIAEQLRVHMEELRSVPQHPPFGIGYVMNGPLQDPVFEYHSSQGQHSSLQCHSVCTELAGRSVYQ